MFVLENRIYLQIIMDKNGFRKCLALRQYLEADRENNAEEANFRRERISITFSELQYAIESAILVIDLSDFKY